MRAAGGDGQRVEERRRRHGEAQPLEAGLEDRGEAMDAPRDRRQPLGAVVDRVHAGHHREQHLRGADVRRRLLAADVLLARLQREPVRRAAGGVDGDADEAPRHRALEVVAGGEVAGVRAAVAHRHAEALRRADDDVGAPFAGRRQQREREQVGGDDDEAAGRVHGVDQRARGRGPRRRRRDTGAARRRRPRRGRVGCGADDDLDAQRLGARAHDVERLRKAVGGDEEPVARPARPSAGRASSPRRRRSPRRASTRWRSPCRSGRRPSSGN